MESQKIEVGSIANVMVEQKDKGVVVVSLNYNGDIYRGILINTTSTIKADTSRTSVPILSKRPKPFTCSSDDGLAVNSQLSDPSLIKTTTENIKMEKSNIPIQPEKTTGITDNLMIALPEVKNTSTDINGNPSITDTIANNQSKQLEDISLYQPIQKRNIQTHDTTDKVNNACRHSLNNDFSNDIHCGDKNSADEIVKTDSNGRDRCSNGVPHLRNTNNNNNNSIHSSNSTNKRRMANNGKYCHGCNDLHGHSNGLSSKKRRRGPKFTSTYYLASSKKSAAANNSTMTSSKMPGCTVDDICNKLHAVAHTKRKSTNNHYGTEKKIKGMKIVNSDNSKTTVKYDPSCRTFQVGDIVWGKVQGHPWWPGRIVSLDATIEEQQLYPCKAVVTWYNSNTCSIITARRLYKFDECYDLRHTPKRRGAYQKAVEDALLASRQQQSYDVVAN